MEANGEQNTHPPIPIPVCILQTRVSNETKQGIDWRPETQFLAAAWRRLAGRPVVEQDGPRNDLPQLLESEWSPMFERLMRNRLVLGALRYGRLGAPGKRRYDRVGSVERRLAAYRDTGNREHLVDSAALLMLEFEEGTHPRSHWAPADDAEHTRECFP